MRRGHLSDTLRRALRALRDFIFPPMCLFCSRETLPGNSVCPDCAVTLPWLNEPFGSTVRAADGCDCLVAPLRYEGRVREAVWRMKFRGETQLIPGLAQLCVQAVSDLAPQEIFDLVVPVPLHRERLRERGYNQAALLARAIGKEIGVPVAEKVLVKHKASAVQHTLSLDQRKENVKGVYSLSGNVDQVKGKRVLLVDDIVTSGCTADACAKVLKSGQACRVVAVCVAHVENKS